MDWLGVVANAVSLAVGVASGSLISYYLLRRETEKLFKQICESNVYKQFCKVLVEANELFGSEEARTFFRRLNELLDSFVKGGGESVKIKLPTLPKIQDKKE
jgi:uncharacterized protein (DUF2384 family)